MQASMVRLPFATDTGDESFLTRLVDSGVSLNAYGCETLNAIITYKWETYARRSIYIKMIIYMIFLACFSALAIIVR